MITADEVEVEDRPQAAASDDPKQRRPDISLAKKALRWKPSTEPKRACRRRSSTSSAPCVAEESRANPAADPPLRHGSRLGSTGGGAGERDGRRFRLAVARISRCQIAGVAAGRRRAGDAGDAKLRFADGTTQTPADAPRVVRDSATQGFRYHYSWGVVKCGYERSLDRLQVALFRLRIHPTQSSTPSDCASSTSPSARFRTARIMDAGMFAMGGTWQPLHSQPLVADTKQMPPVIFVEFEQGLMAFGIEGDAAAADAATPSIPFTSNPTTKRSYPLVVSLAPIAAHKSVATTLTLRFGTRDSGLPSPPTSCARSPKASRSRSTGATGGRSALCSGDFAGPS